MQPLVLRASTSQSLSTNTLADHLAETLGELGVPPRAIGGLVLGPGATAASQPHDDDPGKQVLLGPHLCDELVVRDPDGVTLHLSGDELVPSRQQAELQVTSSRASAGSAAVLRVHVAELRGHRVGGDAGYSSGHPVSPSNRSGGASARSGGAAAHADEPLSPRGAGPAHSPGGGAAHHTIRKASLGVLIESTLGFPVAWLDTHHAVAVPGEAPPARRWVDITRPPGHPWEPPGWFGAVQEEGQGYFVLRQTPAHGPGATHAGPVVLSVRVDNSGQACDIADAYGTLVATARMLGGRTKRVLQVAHGVDAGLVICAVVASAKLA